MAEADERHDDEAFQHLKRSAERVTCPVCNTSQVCLNMYEKWTAADAFAIAIQALFSAGLRLLLLLHERVVTHYCSACGVRLAHHVPGRTFPFATDRMLRDQVTTSAASPARRPACAVASPLGPPPAAVDARGLRNPALRDCAARPMRTLSIDHCRGQEIAARVWDFDSGAELFAVAAGGRDLAAVRALPEPDDHEAWEGARFSVRRSVAAAAAAGDDDGRREVGSVRLAPGTWGTTLGFRADAGASWRTWAERGERDNFGPERPHFRWLSSAGPLVWLRRQAADALSPAGRAPGKHLVLLDAYDRTVALERVVSWPKREEKDGKEEEEASRATTREDATRLYLYGEFDDHLVAEIVVSYVALQTQMVREKIYRAYEATQNSGA